MTGTSTANTSSRPDSEATAKHALVSFPGASYTQECITQACKSILEPRGWTIHTRTQPSDDEATQKWAQEVQKSSSSWDSASSSRMLYLMDYDLIPFDSMHPTRVSSTATSLSSYPIRKALIRKTWLFSAIHSHSVKASSKAGVDVSQSALRHLPRTWNIDVQFADDLDELLIDDLYDLAQELEEDRGKWYIIKAAMADRGMGIRMFNTLDGLRGILDEFEVDSSDEDEDEDEQAQEAGDTSVSLSQLRHFVIQEYLQPPLLIAPNAAAGASAGEDSPTFRKFHLRAYVLCVGGLSVYLCDEMLALFAPSSYETPAMPDSDDDDEAVYTQPDPRIHLTNTCLHSDGSATSDGRLASENVHLLSDLCKSGKPYRTSSGSSAQLTSDHLTELHAMAKQTIGETFEATAKGGASTNWMMWENAWEVFGVDLIVTSQDDEKWKMSLLEVNAQPDFAQSGAKLQNVIQNMFQRCLEVAVLGEGAGESRDGLTLCFSEKLRGGW